MGLLLVRELRWNQDRRQHIAAMVARERSHLLDEAYVADAFARQLEEIRNLPELAP